MVRQTSKKSGAPTRDKLSKALALVQSSSKTTKDEPSSSQNRRPTNLSLTIPSEETGSNKQDSSLLYSAFSSRVAGDGHGKSSSAKGKAVNDFASNLYHTIHNQNQPASSSSENQPRSGIPSKPLTPRAAAVAAAKKTREYSPEKKSAMSPRSAAAAAYVSEKRKVRREHEEHQRHQFFSKKSIEQALVTVSSQGAFSTDSGTSGRRKHSTSRYHREWNSKSHQDDMEAALKVSTDIEKDIQATSQTLAQISQFIDTVSTMPKEKQKRGDDGNKNKGKKNNNSFVQVYQRNVGDASVDSCAAIAEDDDEEEPRETRDPEAIWSSGRETTSEREESQPQHSSPAGSAWEATSSLYGAERQPDGGRIYIADDTEEFDSLATYTSQPADSITQSDPMEDGSRQSPAVSVFAASVKTKDHEKEKEAVYYNVKQPKSSTGFDGLLHTVSSNASGKHATTATRQIPIQAGSPAKSRSKPDAKEDERRDERSASSAPSKSSGKSEDPPNSADVQTMGSKDELQEKKDPWDEDSHTTGSLDSLDDEFCSSIGTPNDPQILSEISAFIDRVEQKNKNGKLKKVSAGSVTSNQFSSAYDFDAATLVTMFDEPIGRALHGKKSAKEKDDLSWQEMERILNSITKPEDAAPNNDKATSASDSGTAKDIEGTRKKSGAASGSAALSKEDDPICLVRGDNLPEENTKRRLQVDPSTETEISFHMMSSISTPTNKPRTTLNKRGADPPPKGEDEEKVRLKEDPPAEDASVSSRSGAAKEPSPTHKANPQAHGKQLSTRHRGPPRPEGPLASGVNPKTVPSAEVAVINVEDTGNTLTSKEIEVIHVEEDSAERSPGQKKALRVNTAGPGSESTPIMVVSPPATEASVFVDLTEVCSGDMDEEKAAAAESRPKPEAGKKASTPKTPNEHDLQFEEDQVKAWMNADINCMSEDQALKELLSMAAEESPRKMPSQGGPCALDIGFSVDSDDGESALEDDDHAYDGGESDTSKSAYTKRNFNTTQRGSGTPTGPDSDYEHPKSELPPTPKVSHRTTKEGSSRSSHSSRSRNPSGEYTGPGQQDNLEVRKPDQSLSENEREHLLETVIGYHPGDIVSEGEDDQNPLQSLLFAQKNNASELAAERKVAGMSLIQLTLDEVKNFVDSNLFEAGEISSEKIKELEQLDERVPTVPSLVTDLGEDIIDVDEGASSSSSESKSEANGSHQASNENQGMPVTYDFQPASKQPVVSQNETNHPTGVVGSTSQSKAAQLIEPSSQSKKGLKRKLLADKEHEQHSSTLTETPRNWLSSLDSIFTCKRPNGSKCGEVAALETGATQEDKHTCPNSPSDEVSYDSQERLIEGTQKNSDDQVEVVHTRFSFSSDRQGSSSPREQKGGVPIDEKSEEIVVSDDDSWDTKEEDSRQSSHQEVEAASFDKQTEEETVVSDDSDDAKKEDRGPLPQREKHEGESINEEIIMTDDESCDEVKKEESPPGSPQEGQESKSADAGGNAEIIVSDGSDMEGKEVVLSALPSGSPTMEKEPKESEAQKLDSDDVPVEQQQQQLQQFTSDSMSSEVDGNQDETIRSEDLEGLPILVNSSEESGVEGDKAALESSGDLPIKTNERQKADADTLEGTQKVKQDAPPSEEPKHNAPHTPHQNSSNERNTAPDPSEAHSSDNDSSDNESETVEPASGNETARNETGRERSGAPDPSEAQSSDDEVDNAESTPSSEESPPSSLEPAAENKPCVSELLIFASQSASLNGDLEWQKRLETDQKKAATNKVLTPWDTKAPPLSDNKASDLEKVGKSNKSVDEYEVAMKVSTEDGRDDTDQKPGIEIQEPLMVDLTRHEDATGDVNEDIPSNAWETLLDLGSLQEESLSSWEKPADAGKARPQDSNQARDLAWKAMTIEEKVAKTLTPRDDATPRKWTTQEKVTTSSTPRDDATPKMHQSKHFEFIEDVNEDANIDAYLSRMTNLKKGGHLPGYNIKALGSYAEKGHEEDTDNVEVDIDVGFVKKSLAPVPNQDHESWDEIDDNLAKHNNRYVSIEESSDDEGDKDAAKLKARLDTISDGDDEDGTSTRGSTVDDRATDDESVGSFKNPIVVVESTSLNEMDDQFPVDDGLHHGIDDDRAIEALQSSSYESDNDEWLRKRDLATRKTQNPKSWLTRTASGIQSKLSFVSIEAPKSINGVAAAKKILSRTAKRRGGKRRNPIPSTNVWRLSYKDRTRDHAGYFNVDVFSLFDSSAVGVQQPHHLDAAPWEMRDVRQHFLQESSIGFSKNWFGKAQRCRGNDRVKERVAHPKSMEMPMESKPHHEEWTEEWYKPWEAPPNKCASRSVTSSYSGTGSGEASDEASDTETGTAGADHTPTSSYNDSVSYSSSANFTSDAETDMDDRSYYYEDTPQCGELINVKPKIGERVSRIHPDYTSQLRRSRWRKKYFPRGTFPYK